MTWKWANKLKVLFRDLQKCWVDDETHLIVPLIHINSKTWISQRIIIWSEAVSCVKTPADLFEANGASTSLRYKIITSRFQQGSSLRGWSCLLRSIRGVPGSAWPDMLVLARATRKCSSAAYHSSYTTSPPPALHLSDPHLSPSLSTAAPQTKFCF